MRESKGELDEIFRQMDRMRRAWEHVSPSKKLNKSQFGTLFALARLSGGREGCSACEGAAKGEKTAPGEGAVRSGNTAPGGASVNDALIVKGRAAASGETTAQAETAAQGTPAKAGTAVPAAKPVTLSELAAAMRQSLPALSQRVTALEEKGFVERVADPADRRVTGLRLTETGRSEMDTAFRRFGGILSQAAARVGRQNMRLLLQLLGELADALNEAAEAADEEY